VISMNLWPVAHSSSTSSSASVVFVPACYWCLASSYNHLSMATWVLPRSTQRITCLYKVLRAVPSVVRCFTTATTSPSTATATTTSTASTATETPTTSIPSSPTTLVWQKRPNAPMKLSDHFSIKLPHLNRYVTMTMMVVLPGCSSTLQLAAPMCLCTASC
jgi:hypothetical protein